MKMLKRMIPTGLIAASLSTGMAHANPVEIYLTDILDNTQAGYCIDISGGKGADADPANGLQGHTCYSPLGQLLVDQIFDTDRFSEGTLYMTEFDVCAQMTGFDAGATVDLATCDGNKAQSFAFTGEGTITPTSAPEMCLTVGAETRSGRSDTNQIKTLSLQPCDADMAAYQTWATRSE
jgi:hypothetical protein